jgi:xanthine/uracil/vitamin C permease (AzgA family)
MAACFILGFLLMRFNVFGALVATAICTVISSFIYVVISNLTLAQALVMSLATAFVLQVGYLVGQFLCDPPKRGKLGF